MPKAKRARRMSSAPAVAPAVVGKIPQPHGGALYAGGVPGNRSSAGTRAPSVIRAVLREDIYTRLPKLRAIADGKDGASITEQLRALELLMRFAVGPVPPGEGEQGDRGPLRTHPRFQLLLDTMLTALGPYPEAKAALASALVLSAGLSAGVEAQDGNDAA
jgi:hypothetical protein